MWARFLVSCLLAAPVFGVTIGELQTGGAFINTGTPGSPLTTIDVARPAVAAGSVKYVTLTWAGAPAAGCANAFKIKFFRPVANGVIQVLASYGPFNVQNGVNSLVIPPTNIQRGDWIGVTQMTFTCGGVAQAAVDTSEVRGVIFGDPTGTATAVSFVGGYVPNIVASTTAEVLQGYFIVAGSLRGSGAEFKTSAQLTNLGSATITGKLIFHPANVATLDSDRSLAYSLTPLKSVSYNDVVQAMGASGLGTMDLVLTSGYPPDVSMRIYSDAGVNGTSGLTEELRTPRQAHYQYEDGSFNLPADLTKFRLNIGYRAQSEGASVTILVYDANGALVHVADRVLPANTMKQESAAAFSQQPTLPPGGLITFQLTAGSAFFYGATTDNRTADPNLRFATKF
ncbi:MAG: hypothetical protein ACJ74H_16705 [Thermoanaerobaculia bacterium]